MKRNPEYKSWTAGVPAAQQGLVAFVNAAAWPDCIKGNQCPGYTSDGPNGGNTPPNDPSASQNIGYADHLMHKYWHFIDIPFATKGMLAAPAPSPNVVTQILLFRTALASKASDDVKSYDIVWLEHLVGDIHQPLHAIQRYTTLHPTGDAGGNLVRFCVAPCELPDNLHSYWDNLIGLQSDFESVRNIAGSMLGQTKPVGRLDPDVEGWSEQSAELARQYAYASPIGADNDPQAPLSPRPDDTYQSRARRIAWEQVFLAGYRLAFLLNTNLKR